MGFGSIGVANVCLCVINRPTRLVHCALLCFFFLYSLLFPLQTATTCKLMPLTNSTNRIDDDFAIDRYYDYHDYESTSDIIITMACYFVRSFDLAIRLYLLALGSLQATIWLQLMICYYAIIFFFFKRTLMFADISFACIASHANLLNRIQICRPKTSLRQACV